MNVKNILKNNKRMLKMSNTKEIRKLAKLKSENTKNKVLEVLDDMVKNNENITFYSVYNKAGVSKSFVYNNEEVREAIEHYRTNPVKKTQSKDAKDVIIDSQKFKIKELEMKIKELENDKLWKVKYEELQKENMLLKRQLEKSYDY